MDGRGSWCRDNGAGNSTLMRVRAGIVAPDAVVIEVRGSRGYCPHEPVVNGAVTFEQHLRYFAFRAPREPVGVRMASANARWPAE